MAPAAHADNIIDTSTPHPNDRKRIWVRGCPVDSDCSRALQSDMKQFDARLGRTRNNPSPWLAASRKDNARVKPSSVDPKLAWLDHIRMPDLPIRWTPELIAYLKFYKNTSRGRNIMADWLIQQGKYEVMIVSILRRAGLPTDLLYISMIESSYNPREYSRAGASGLWQFMPSGARIYGMTVNHWIDERRDPVKSTKAVVMYFRDLYHRFRNWHLALGAFNQGYNGMLRAIARYNTNDYWQLLRYENALPRDTALYVPKALAAAIIGRNRKLFGFDRLKLKPPLKWDEVMVPRSTSLRVLARAAGVSEKQLHTLNPQLSHNRTPPGMRNYTVRLPRGSGRRFARDYDHYRRYWDRYDTYTVSHGERLRDIADKHGMSVRKLAALNEIRHRHSIGGGEVLLVPRLREAQKRANLERAKQRRLRRARRKHVLPVLVAVPDKNVRVAGKRRVFYRVIRGDSLHGVARAFGVDRRALASWNGIDARGHLYRRMVLQVFVDRDFDARRKRIKLLDDDDVMVVTRGSAEHLRLTELRRGRERMIYRCTKRESFAHIGQQFGLTARDLARINRQKPGTVVEPGDEIVVYKVIDPSRSYRARRQNKRLRARQRRIEQRKAAALAKKRAAERARRRAEERKRAAERKRRRAKRRKYKAHKPTRRAGHHSRKPPTRQARSKHHKQPTRQARSKHHKQPTRQARSKHHKQPTRRVRSKHHQQPTRRVRSKHHEQPTRRARSKHHKQPTRRARSKHQRNRRRKRVPAATRRKR